MDRDATRAQFWYGEKTGYTFVRKKTVTVRGYYHARYYGAGVNSTAETYYRIYNELAARRLIDSHTRAVVQLGFRSMSNCGVASGHLAISDPFKGCGNIQDSVIAHEIGHTLLNSSNADHTRDGTLMHQPLACAGRSLSSCGINSYHRNSIAHNPWANLNWRK